MSSMTMSESLKLFNQVLEYTAVQYPYPNVVEFIKQTYLITWHGITSDRVLTDLWDRYRQDRDVFNFLMTLTTTYQVDLNMASTDQFGRLSSIIGQSIDALISDEGAFTDESFRLMRPTLDFESIMNKNPWVVILYMIGRSDISLPVQAINKLLTSKTDQ